MTLKDKFTYRLLHVASRWMRRLSNTARSRFANKLGAFAFNRIPIRKELAYNNIKTAFPDKSETWVNNVLIGTYRLFFTNFFINFTILENNNEINIFFDKQTYDLIGWQNTDMYQNFNITFLSSIRKNRVLSKNLFNIPAQN